MKNDPTKKMVKDLRKSIDREDLNDPDHWLENRYIKQSNQELDDPQDYDDDDEWTWADEHGMRRTFSYELKKEHTPGIRRVIKEWDGIPEYVLFVKMRFKTPSVPRASEQEVLDFLTTNLPGRFIHRGLKNYIIGFGKYTFRNHNGQHHVGIYLWNKEIPDNHGIDKFQGFAGASNCRFSLAYDYETTHIHDIPHWLERNIASEYQGINE